MISNTQPNSEPTASELPSPLPRQSAGGGDGQIDPLANGSHVLASRAVGVPPQRPGHELPLLASQLISLSAVGGRLEGPAESRLYEVSELLNIDALEEALGGLIWTHQALRLRLILNGHGGCDQVLGPIGGNAAVLFWHELPSLDEVELGLKLENLVAEAGRSLEYERGPMLRLDYLDQGKDRPGLLLLVAHTLILDDCSWEVLVRDLESAYRDSSKSLRAPLQPGVAYTELHEGFVRSTRLTPQEAHYWRETLASLPVASPARELNLGDNLLGSLDTVGCRFSEDATSRLLGNLAKFGPKSLTAAVLAGLAKADFAADGLGVLVKHNPRAKMGERFSNVVGHLSFPYPVKLPVEQILGAEESEDELRISLQVMEQAAAAAEAFPAYWLECMNANVPVVWPRILVDAELSDSKTPAGFRFLRKMPYSRQDTYTPRAVDHELRLSRHDGRLLLEWTYSRNLHRRESAVAMLQEVVSAVSCYLYLSEPPSAAPAPAPEAEVATEPEVPTPAPLPVALPETTEPAALVQNTKTPEPRAESVQDALLVKQSERLDKVERTLASLKTEVRGLSESISGLLNFLLSGQTQQLWPATPPAPPTPKLIVYGPDGRGSREMELPEQPIEISEPAFQAAASAETVTPAPVLLLEPFRQAEEMLPVDLPPEEEPKAEEVPVIAQPGPVLAELTVEAEMPPELPAIPTTPIAEVAEIPVHQASAAVDVPELPVLVSPEVTLPEAFPEKVGEVEVEIGEPEACVTQPKLEPAEQEQVASQPIAPIEPLAEEAVVVAELAETPAIPALEPEAEPELALPDVAELPEIAANVTVSEAHTDAAEATVAEVSEALAEVEVDSKLVVSPEQPAPEAPAIGLSPSKIMAAFLKKAPVDAPIVSPVNISSSLPILPPEPPALVDSSSSDVSPDVFALLQPVIPVAPPLQEAAAESPGIPPLPEIEPEPVALPLTDLPFDEKLEPTSLAAEIEEQEQAVATLLPMQESVPESAEPELDAEPQPKPESEVGPEAVISLPTKDVGCLHQFVELWAEKDPLRVALVFGSQSTTYQELNERANRLAHYLISVGVSPGDIVGIYLDRGESMVVAMLAVMKVGGAFLFMDLSYPRERLAYLMEDSGARLLLSQGRLVGRLPSNARHHLLIDTMVNTLGRMSSENPALSLPSESLAQINYVSHPAGVPRGSFATHSEIIHLVEAAKSAAQASSEDGWLFMHSLAAELSVVEAWGALSSGGRLLIAQDVVLGHPENLFAFIQAHGVTVMHLTSVELGLLVDKLHLLPKLRLCLLSSLPVTEEQMGDWLEMFAGKDGLPRIVFFAHLRYPLAPIGSFPLLANWRPDTANVLTNPHPGLKTLVLTEALSPCSPGETGELFLGGGPIQQLLQQHPELVSRVVKNPLPNPGDPSAELLFRSGELAVITETGRVKLLGIKGTQVVLKGFRVELGEVEALLNARPDLSQCVVVGRPQPVGEPILNAFLVSHGDRKPTQWELRDYLAHYIPDFMAPLAYHFLEQLPLDPSGKVDRLALATLPRNRW